MHLLLSLRTLRCAWACGSKELNSFVPHPGFRDPVNHNNGGCRTLSTLGYSYAVPTALCLGCGTLATVTAILSRT